MKLRQIEYFLGVMEYGGFAKAAARLFVAQSALSTQIKSLEDELGAALFMRLTHGVRLTEAGSLLLRHARVISAQVASCKRDFHELVSNEIRGVVRLGMVVSASRMLTIPLLHRVAVESPSVSLHVIEALTADLEHYLDSGSLDLAIGFNCGEPAPPANEHTLTPDVLRMESFYLVSAAKEKSRVGPPIDVQDLDRIDLIVPTRRYATRRFLDEQMAKKGKVLKIQHELDSLEQAMEMVLAGEGRSLMMVSTFLANWRAGKVLAKPLVGLTRQPQLFIRESGGTASRASGRVKQLAFAITQELTSGGTWPSKLEEIA